MSAARPPRRTRSRRSAPRPGRRGTPHRHPDTRPRRGSRSTTAIHQKFVEHAERHAPERAVAAGRAGEPEGGGDAAEASLTETYKTGGEDAVSYLLAARSIGELVDQMQVMQRVNGINKTLLNQVTRYKAEVPTRQARLAKQLKPVNAQQEASAAAKRAGARGARPAADLHQQPEGVDPADHRRAPGRRRSVPPRPPPALRNGTSATSRRRRRARSAARRSRSPSSTSACRTSGAARAPTGFDCSGLVMYVYAQLGVSLPHNAAAQYGALPHVPHERPRARRPRLLLRRSATSGSTSAAA